MGRVCPVLIKQGDEWVSLGEAYLPTQLVEAINRHNKNVDKILTVVDPELVGVDDSGPE
jgi:hypothetical protein